MEEQAAARLIYKSKCRMSDERLGARDCSWSLMADASARVKTERSGDTRKIRAAELPKVNLTA